MRVSCAVLCTALALSGAEAAHGPRRALLQPMSAPAAAPAAAPSGDGAVKAMEAQSSMLGTGNPLLLSGAGATSTGGPPAVAGQWITTPTGSVWAMAPPANTGTSRGRGAVGAASAAACDQ